ncbi:hypothetical protein EMN47_17435 [Prolixibacteraceae bacterium JC049]|nr:hypothetical protein [Prolixibacteraceae bacterium JC049]
MDERLYSLFQEETTNDLFYKFKHDGSLNFDHKIVAGALLYERNYELKSLQEEKRLIIAKLKQQLQDLGSPSEIEEAIRKKTKRSLIASIVGFTFSLGTIYFAPIHKIDSSELIKQALLGLNLLAIVYTIVRFEKRVGKRVDKKLNKKMKELKLYQKRLNDIEVNWHF